jgi:hypothetical protein
MGTSIVITPSIGETVLLAEQDRIKTVTKSDREWTRTLLILLFSAKIVFFRIPTKVSLLGVAIKMMESVLYL